MRYSLRELEARRGFGEHIRTVKKNIEAYTMEAAIEKKARVRHGRVEDGEERSEEGMQRKRRKSTESGSVGSLVSS